VLLARQGICLAARTIDTKNLLRTEIMRKFKVSLAAMALAATGFVSNADAALTEIAWGGTTGNRNWQDNANWVGGVFPDGPADIDALAPNNDILLAKLAVNLGSNLTVDLGPPDIGVARLSIGSMSQPITTTINSVVSGGTSRLLFRNEDPEQPSATEDADFNNDTKIDGRDFLIWQRGFGSIGDDINDKGDANFDDVVDGADLPIWQAQYGLGSGIFNIGAPGIESTGVAGVTNTIESPIHIVNQQLEIGGTRNLTLTGAMTFEGNPNNVEVPNQSNSGVQVVTSTQTVTMNGNIAVFDSDAVEGAVNYDFRINDNNRASGTFVMNGLITGTGHLIVGRASGGSTLGTVQLNSANTFTGRFAAGRGNLVLGHDDALGKSLTIDDNDTPGDTSDDFYPRANYTHIGPSNSVGYNFISTADNRNIANPMNLSQWQTVKGEHSLTLSGHISQTNNRGFVNELPAGKTLNITGDIDVFDSVEPNIERRFTFDGPGKTIVSGTINDNEVTAQTGYDYGILKRGTGVLVIDVDAGDNNHSGFTVVQRGNLHFADNDSLNVSTNTSALIRSVAGAVGVDVHPAGQTLATNLTFIGKFEAQAQGGLMLASTDANTDINFTAAAPWTRVRGMSLAAPETGITYTGTITPYQDVYRLGGGQGTLTMPNAQLTGARSLSVRNGGVVKLTGLNTYSQGTTIEGKYTATMQSEPIEGDDGTFLTPVLEVNTLANGGANSSIGSSGNAAANLFIQGGTLRYSGTGSNTDRLFTMGTHGATIESSGTGAVAFTNTGSAVAADITGVTGTLDDFTGNPNVVTQVNVGRDIVIGMTVADNAPAGGSDFTQAPCAPNGANCIPALVDEDLEDPNNALVPVVVTGVSDNQRSFGINANYPFIQKFNTALTFGPVARTLTLGGSNTGANVISPVISNSAAGSVVGIAKKGTGNWYLESANTNTGPTLVEAGTLGGNGGVGGALTVNSGSTFTPGTPGVANGVGDFSVGGSFVLEASSILGVQLGGTSAGQYDVLNVTGAATLRGAINLSTVAGFSPALSNQFTVLTAAGGITDAGLTITGLTGFTKSIVGNSLVLTKTAALSALASVPEPASMTLIGMALAFFGFRRK
jgi:autotransporter-associated beta strand protein